MKGVLIILDGIGDLPCKILNDKTPLEAAETPNLDFISNRGELGGMVPVKIGFIPESDEATVSIFGNEISSSTRGQLEARGTDIKLVRGDLALRANFATIDSTERKNIIDRRAGRTLATKEAETLAEALNKIKMPCDFIFKPTIQHRGVLVFKGGFSDNISGNDSSYTKNKLRGIEKINEIRALDENENSQYAANIVNEFLEKAFMTLDKHPLNEERKRKGLMPANYLLVRGAGIETPKLKFYRKWAAVCYMPTEIGFAKTSGMSVFSFKYPEMKNLDVYKNLYDGLREACDFSVKTIEKNRKKYDYFYVHIKETDVPGHDNKPVEKKMMIEQIDKILFKFLKKSIDSDKNLKIIVTGDHSTPCRMKSHSAEPVPVLFYSGEGKAPKEKRFCERDAMGGKLGMISGKDLLEKTGFEK
ncbi:2,3-bisphosphoglycerate-independent phosphoglycerate mutase [Candidatus Pacearchaeota archaeon]|nr:2,3-bisphosphoglycerate-independent phosphoglycerate mutase [Candidatus Pacearchaeota archaeon]